MDKVSFETETFLLGGSFDPVHKGHKALVHFLLREYNPQQVWIIPVARQPLKKEANLNFINRCELLELAFQNLIKKERLKINKIEHDLPTPSYTSQTYEELQRRYPSQKFRWVLGDDVNDSIEHWHRLDWLKQHLPIIILQRQKNKVNSHIKEFKDCLFSENPLWEFSSSEIRKELFVVSKAKEEAIYKYMPEETWEKMKALLRQGS